MKLDNMSEKLTFRVRTVHYTEPCLEFLIDTNYNHPTEEFVFKSDWSLHEIDYDSARAYFAKLSTVDPKKDSIFRIVSKEEIINLILPFLKDNYSEMLFLNTVRTLTVEDLLTYAPK